MRAPIRNGTPLKLCKPVGKAENWRTVPSAEEANGERSTKRKSFVAGRTESAARLAADEQSSRIVPMSSAAQSQPVRWAKNIFFMRVPIGRNSRCPFRAHLGRQDSNGHSKILHPKRLAE